MRKKHRFRWVAKWIAAIVCLAFAVAYALRVRSPLQLPWWIPFVAALALTLLLMWTDRRTPSRPSPGRLLRPNLQRKRTFSGLGGGTPRGDA